MKVYTELELKKLIKAFQLKYNDAGCEGLPYQPESIDVQFFAIVNYPPMPGGCGVLLKPSTKYTEHRKMEWIEPTEEIKNLFKERADKNESSDNS